MRTSSGLVEKDASDNATWDRNAPAAVADDDGDPNEDLDLQVSGQASSQHSSGTTPSVLSRPKSRGSIGPYRETYLMAARQQSNNATLMPIVGPSQISGVPSFPQPGVSLRPWRETQSMPKQFRMRRVASSRR